MIDKEFGQDFLSLTVVDEKQRDMNTSSKICDY